MSLKLKRGDWIFYVPAYTSDKLTPAPVIDLAAGIPGVLRILPPNGDRELVARTVQGAFYLLKHLKQKPPIAWAILPGPHPGPGNDRQNGALGSRGLRRLPKGVGWCDCCGVASVDLVRIAEADILGDSLPRSLDWWRSAETSGPGTGAWICPKCHKAPKQEAVFQKDFCSVCQRPQPVLVFRTIYPAPDMEVERLFCYECLDMLDALRIIQKPFDKER